MFKQAKQSNCGCEAARSRQMAHGRRVCLLEGTKRSQSPESTCPHGGSMTKRTTTHLGDSTPQRWLRTAVLLCAVTAIGACGHNKPSTWIPANSTSLAVLVIDVSPSIRAAKIQDRSSALVKRRCAEFRTAVAELDAAATGVFRFQLMQVGSANGGERPTTLMTWRELSADNPGLYATPGKLAALRAKALQTVERACVEKAHLTPDSPIRAAAVEATEALALEHARLAKSGQVVFTTKHLWISSDFDDPAVVSLAAKHQRLAQRHRKSARARAKDKAKRERIASRLRVERVSWTDLTLCGLADSESSVGPALIRRGWQLALGTNTSIAPSCAREPLSTHVADGGH